MTGNMTIIQYASKFTELSWFTQDFVTSERMKMRRFEEGLAFYIRNQLVGQPVKTYQELYEQGAEVERVKNELTALNPRNPKRKWNDHKVPNDNISFKKPVVSSAESHVLESSEPCGKCGRTNHRTSECCAGINKCLWCGSTEHTVATYPKRLSVVEKGVVKSSSPPHQVQAPEKPFIVGRAYITSKKEASNSGTVVTGTLFLNSKPFSVLFNSGATHSFISTRAALLLNLEDNKEEVEYKIGLLNGHVLKCSTLYKDVPIMIGGHRFPGDLIQFDLSEFDVALGIN